MASYKLSGLAQDDLLSIYKYGVVRWGLSQADTYYDALIIHLQQIADDPLRYPPTDHIKAGLRRSVFKSHAVYFVVSNGSVDILAIIRSQDTARIR